MDTDTQTRRNVELAVKVHTLLDDVIEHGGIEPFEDERYEILNHSRGHNHNATMLPDAQMVWMNDELYDRVYEHAHRVMNGGNCGAVYTDVPGHAVACRLGYKHEGLHINIQCGDINAIWE